MKMGRSILGASLVLVGAWLSGCASITGDTAQAVKIETKTKSGEMISGAECVLTNEYGSTTAKSGTSPIIRRSSKDLDITCKSAEKQDAVARAISRANAGMYGNIIFGGGIGAIIDHSKGTAYTYPTWVQLIFGETLVFDRSSEKEGAPVPGMSQGPTAMK